MALTRNEMSFFSIRRTNSEIRSPGRQQVRVLIAAFERVRCPDPTREAALLTFVVNGAQGVVPVSMSWEALAMLRSAAAAAGVETSDHRIVTRVLQEWGREQVRTAFERGEALPIEGFVLDFDCGPSSPEPGLLLGRAGLLSTADCDWSRQSWRKATYVFAPSAVSEPTERPLPAA